MASERQRFVFTELELSDEEIERLLLSAAQRPPSDISSALAQLEWRAPATAAPARAARAYRPSEVAVVLGVFAAAILTFDSEGLMTWVQRMELGPVQSAWRAALAPVSARMERAGLTAARRWLVREGDRLSLAFGSHDDPVLAEGWSTPGPAPEPAAPLAPSPPPAGPIIAAEAPEPTASPEAAPPGEAAAPSKPGPVTVLLLGDSMIAGSLGTALTRALGRDPRMRVVEAFQTATGLSRPDIFDWMKVLPPLLEREHPGLIICSLGANDPTTIRDGDRELDFGEPGWRSVYSERVRAMMRIFSATGAKVLWLGLPPMREARFSAHAAWLNAIFSQSAAKVPGVEFLELRMLVSDPATGEYATFVLGPDGKVSRYRLDDGIHYSPAGARAITRWVVDWIYERYRKLPAN